MSPLSTAWRLLNDAAALVPSDFGKGNSGKAGVGSDPLAPRPAQSLPGKLGTATDTLIGWSITAALIACALGFIMGWGLVGIGNNAERPEMAARGKRSVLWSCVAAMGVGMVFALLKAFYGLGA